MKKVFVRALTLLLAVSMLFVSACGKEDVSDSATRSTASTTITTTVTQEEENTTTTAENTTATATAGESTTATTAKPTASQTIALTKPSKTGTTAVTPKDPTSAFAAEFEGWLENLTEYKIGTPKMTTVTDGTVMTYTLTGAKNSADYCVHIHSAKDKSIRAAFVTVEEQKYDFMFSVVSYYVYASLGLTKMDADAFLAQFDAFPNELKLENAAEGDYRMSCLTIDEFLTFAVAGKGVPAVNEKLVGQYLQSAACGGCYDDVNRALNYMVLTDKAEDLGITSVMLERALVSQGNRTRIANVMRRALKGEKITIGYIGGSVTEGAYASDYNKTSYAGLSFAWWEKTFPKADFTFVKAGVGGTSSLFGVHRVQEDLLKYNPDFVIVEFGVNDCDHRYQTEAYANLLHRILTYSSQPAVMQLYVMNEDGSNRQSWQTPIGNHYDLPQISYRDAVYPEVKNGTFAWSEIGADWVHPTNQGHAMIAELLIAYLTKTYQDLDKITTTVPAVAKSYVEYVYGNAAYYHKGNLTPLSMSGFKAVSNKNTSWFTGGKGTITFEFTGKRCILALPASYYKTDWDVSIRIDGGTAVTMNGPLFSGGAFANVLVFDEDVVGKHTIEIICNSGSMYIGGLFIS